MSLLVPVQEPGPDPRAVLASLRGTTTTQKGTVIVPGVEITVIRVSSDQIAVRAVTDDEGNFSFEGMKPGSYRVEARLQGFADTLIESVMLKSGAVAELNVDLPIARLEQSVDVVAEKGTVPQTGSSQETVMAEQVDILPVKGDDFRSLLPLLPGVIRSTDGRIVMKGAGATQGSLVVNSSTNVTDPATGNFGFTLPSDAIESVEILPNPYSAEFGRFSSGVTNILTRQGTPKWKFTVNNFIPRPKIRDGTIMGIGAFTPRFGARGPLIKDRLFLAQTFQYRFIKTRVPGQPELVNDTRLESVDAFTQLDANLSERHTLSATFSLFPRKLDFVNLNTFNPLEVTTNFHQRGYSMGLSERTTFTSRAILESTISFKRYDVDIFGQGHEEMWIAPDGNSGNFFNVQRRQTRSWQWVEALTLAKSDWWGEHLFKFGLDLLHTSLDGSSQSRPVNILRADGTLSQRYDFSVPSAQRVRSTDSAFYVQDRWRFSDRVLFELGTRFDRDGVLERNHLSPRLGLVIGVIGEGTGVLRGGAGLFYERTALTVGAFPTYERPSVTSFAADGETQQGPPLTFDLELAPGLRTPYSFTWNLEYDHRLSSRLLLKGNFLQRNGHHEFVLDPIPHPAPQWRLDSRGRSRYWEMELTTRYTLGEESYLLFSYVRSRARRDLNAFDDFFGNLRNPLLRSNEYSLAGTDTPHRFLFQGTTILPGQWIVSPVIEVREGFPYSAVNEDQEFVGPRNLAGRFPNLVTVDLDVQRWFKLWKWDARIGVRFFNIFNSFNPRDVQSNIDSAGFGVFSNSMERLIGGTFQIESRP